MRQGYEVSWMPSYGPEMRGGEANCAVVVSDEPIGSPLVSEPPVLVAMNKPSLMKFMPMMPAGGTLLYNASLIEGVELRTDVTVIPVACNEVAEQLGNGRVSNMVMLGAIQAATEVAVSYTHLAPKIDGMVLEHLVAAQHQRADIVAQLASRRVVRSEERRVGKEC